MDDIDNVLVSVGAALAPDATSEARAAGATACRAVLAALEATPGQRLAAVVQGPPINASAIASAVAALRGVPPDQLLDLAISRLRAALPAEAHVPSVAPLKFHIIPISAPRRTP